MNDHADVRSVADSPLRLADRLRRAVARGLARLPARAQVLLSGEPPVTVDGLTLDPHVQLVRSLRRGDAQLSLCEPTPREGRARFRREMRIFSAPRTRVGSTRDFTIPGEAGPLRVRHYAPEGSGARPLTIYLHGGGFVIGDLDTHDEPCRVLCRCGDTHVLSVDYRLAPEHPFPAALHDTLWALRWGQANAASLGADPARVAIGGDSAGGNLAAVAARLATEAGAPPIAQLLIYPATDSVTLRRSHELFGESYFLSYADRDGFNRAYVGGTGVTGDDPRVSPLRATNLAGLPPALVVTAGFDMLRDEGEAYAAALQAAGTPTCAVRVARLGHGFLHMTGVTPAAHRALVELAREWRMILERAPDSWEERP